MSPITPCLWFDDNLEEAMEFYVKIFPNSSIGSVSRYGEAGPGEPGTVVSGDWTLNGLAFRGINGGPVYANFTEAISFSVACQDQTEVDYYWDNLVAGGEPASAPGSRTSSGSPGRSSRRASPSCCPTRTPLAPRRRRGHAGHAEDRDRRPGGRRGRRGPASS